MAIVETNLINFLLIEFTNATESVNAPQSTNLSSQLSCITFMERELSKLGMLLLWKYQKLKPQLTIIGTYSVN